jgi:hypothetical protein
VEGGVKNKIKPHFMGWYENDFQAELGVRRMKPIERHFYRALLIQSFFCAERPYLPNDDDQLWVLADADSKEHWMGHRDVVVAMFKKYGATRYGHPRVLRDWKATEEKYKGKSKLQDSLGRPEVEVTGGKQNRTEQTITTANEISSTPSQIRSKSGQDDQGQAPSLGKKGDPSGGGSGKSVASKTESEKPKASAVLVEAFWSAVAEKKNDNGKWCGAKDEEEDVPAMRSAVQAYGEDVVRLCLEHFRRSDYWGQHEQGKIAGVPGFVKAIPSIRKQAMAYLEKVKETAALKKGLTPGQRLFGEPEL